MKIIVTGSIGHISKPLTQQLVNEGHNVIVISSNAERQADIETLGATAAIGTLQDVDFFNRNLYRCRCRLHHGAAQQLL